MAIAGLAACSAGDPTATINDPYEAQNRQIHAFNKGLDGVFPRPAGRALASVPEGLTRPVSNFADNVGLPGAVLNGVLQGDIGGASTNLMRFLINSTVGIGGLADPAGVIGLNEEKTDFGETLYVWGIDEGAYLELPLLGPSTQRAALGEVVDMVIDPVDAVGLDPQIRYGTLARAGDIVITRGRFGDTIDGMLYDSADSYAQARLAYLQNRRFDLGQDASAEAVIDPFAGDLDLGGFE